MRFKTILAITILLATLIPGISFASTCSNNGITVVYINGIKTNEQNAKKTMGELQKAFEDVYGKGHAVFLTGYNPSHLAGFGDIAETISQMRDSSISNYDRDTILLQIHPEITTRKILLVGHSQGTLYTNEIYDYLLKNGETREAIGVYNVATPASFVAGSGAYLTSENDKVINLTRDNAKHIGAKPPLDANINIALTPEEAADPYGGHSFNDVYLANASGRIISEINTALKKLSAAEVPNTADAGCFTPPERNFAYKMQEMMFALVDPAASTGIGAVTGAIAAIYDASAATTQMAAAIYNVVGTKIAQTIAERVAILKRISFGAAGTLYGSSVSLNDLADQPTAAAPEVLPPTNPTPVKSTASPDPPPSPKAITQKISVESNSAAPIEAKPPVGGLASIGDTKSSSSSSPSSGSISGSTGVNPAGSSDSSSSNSSSSSSSSSSSPVSSAVAADTTPPSAPVITAPSADGAVSTSTTLIFTGTAEASSAISNNATNATTTADTTGAWSLSLAGLAQGTNTILFYATDASGNVSVSSSRIIVVDTTPPSTSLSISTCNQSLSISGCLLATTTLALAWASTADDLDSYSISCTANGSSCSNLSFSSTHATSTTYTAPSDNTDYIFTATARDTHGNTSAIQTQTVSVATQPVVINEVAWAGTSAARAEDEWIELYNPTNSNISLAGWNLRSATDNTPYIALAGTIAARGFFVLERTNDTTINDITANQIYAGALNNSGEQLVLSHASTTIDQTPAIATFGAWAGGQATAYTSMERIDPLASGTVQANWSTFPGFLANSHNADNVAIQGTPGRRNSANYLPPTVSAGSSLTLTRANSPYIITSPYTVPASATLAIEPGAIIKFYNVGGSITVHGSISVPGTTVLPIVFSSFHDDDCGIVGGCGDTDATTTIPAMGDWTSIVIASDAASATFAHTIIRYGGATGAAGSFGANLRIQNNAASVSDSVIEYSKLYGIRMDNAGSGVSMTNSILANNNRNVPGQTSGSGMYLQNSSPAVSGNQFTGNVRGLVMDGASAPVLTGNAFTANTSNAIESTNSYPISSGSTASGNGGNGMAIQFSISHDYTLPTDLPTIMQGENSVLAGATLTIPAGAVIKSSANTKLTVLGTLTAAGTAASRVIFTSLKDDTVGGDTNGDGAATSPAPGNWKNIIFTQNLATSTLAYATVRYGGASSLGFNNGDTGALRMAGASIVFANSILEYNAYAGMRMDHSTSTVISDSFIRHHAIAGNNNTEYGLFLFSNSVPTISNTRFTDNETHIYNTSTPAYTDGGGNVFDL